MALPPQKFREIVLQMLYASDFGSADPEEEVPFFMHEHKVTRKSAAEAAAKVKEILSFSGELDGKIRSCSTEYAFERIGRVELGVLRLGAYELFHDASIPAKVAIAEAIRLCRKFGSPESAKFVNAILDGLYKAPC